MNQYKEKWRRSCWILDSITCSHWENWWKGKHRIAAPTWMCCGSFCIRWLLSWFFFPSFVLLLLVLLKVSRALNSIYCSSLLLSPVPVSSVLLPAVSGAALLFDNPHRHHPCLHLRPWWREMSQITEQFTCLVSNLLLCIHIRINRSWLLELLCSHWCPIQMTFAFSSFTFFKNYMLLHADQLQAGASLSNRGRDFGIRSDDMKNLKWSTKSLLTKQI